ncbi:MULTISPECIES: hypothetical protein [Pseudoalteromonas]|uniref:hypothetical protein n=1 Tax=Pseudoalteromonas TaxID=53246 RepID=UPI000299E5A7|nr:MULTISPECIES: hypothetical protein [Pseudoalteromonas]TMN34913.1 hypothetical protein CWC03_16040 [Pseudoalteromonas sp. S2755]
MSNEADQQAIDTIAEELGQPDFSSFETDSPEITGEIMASEGGGQSVSVGAGDMTVIVAKFATGYMARRNGEHWNLQPEEAEELSKAMDALVPDMNLSPTWAAVAVVTGIFAPRIITDMQIQEEIEINGGEDDQSKAAS